MAANQLPNDAVHEVSNIARWYDNRSVFITGATGFMGKVLVEKLLTSCPGIQNVYILLRRKKDVSPEMRLEQLKALPIFDSLRQTFPQRLNKLMAITGDILLPELGVSAEEQKILCSSVSVVFHSAATVKFDEVLRLSVSMNMLGTRRLINLTRKMSKLEAFVHVSTAYCNCDRAVVEEVVYPPPEDVDKLLQCLDCMDDEMIDMLTPKLIGNRPNTYTFTKAMAEHLLIKEGAGLPITIVRPSIVTAAHMSPLPGWVDNLNGPTGMFTGAGKGLLRSIFCIRKMRGDLIPVDLCINLLVAAAWSVASHKTTSVKVYNMTSGANNPVLWGEMEKYGLKYMKMHPFDDALWYPSGTFKDNRIENEIYVALFQFIPAYIIDFGARLFGKKASMVKVQTKLKKALAALEYFVTHEWTFINKNVEQLMGRLSESDRKTFGFDTRVVKWEPYVEKYVIGIRKYLLKEHDKDIPRARQHTQKMFVLHTLTKFIFYYTIWKIIISYSALAKNISYGVISLAVKAAGKVYGK